MESDPLSSQIEEGGLVTAARSAPPHAIHMHAHHQLSPDPTKCRTGLRECQLARSPHHPAEYKDRILIELLTSDRILEAYIEGSKFKIYGT